VRVGWSGRRILARPSSRGAFGSSASPPFGGEAQKAPLTTTPLTPSPRREFLPPRPAERGEGRGEGSAHHRGPPLPPSPRLVGLSPFRGRGAENAAAPRPLHPPAAPRSL